MKDLVDALERRLNLERQARREAELQLQSCRQELEQAAEQMASLRRGGLADLAGACHEIRTPLTAIIGFAELLLNPQAAQVDRDEAVSTIIRNGRHLLAVVNEMLDVSKIESGQVEVERVALPMPVLLRELTELVAGKIEERRLAFHVEPVLPLPALVHTDPVRLKQILLNFFGNAVKFTRTGAVTLALGWDAGARTLRLSVIDTGIGMTPEQVARLFRPFAQAKASTTRKFGGTGLGLHICAQLARLLEAHIAVDSTPGRGSAFHLDLAQPETDEAATLLEREADLFDIARPAFAITEVDVPALRGRVLLADDTPDIRRLVTAYLQQAGLAVELAVDGREALDKGLAQRFDLILMDMQMPVLDGLDATRGLRAAGVQTPIVALTASVLASDSRRYRECGCVEVLAKPVDREAFYDLLTRHLGDAVAAATDADTAELQATIAELRQQFLAALPGQLQRFENAQARGDWAEAGAIAHTLKGTAGSFGFGRLTELAGLAELAILAEETVRAAMLGAQVLGEGRRVLASA